MISSRSLITIIKADPARTFWIFALTHLVLWTVAAAITCPNAPLDVIEGYAWGHEWALGTYKHPPMQAWILQALALFTGRAPWAHFLASQIAVVTAFWAVWQTGRRVTDETGALIGVLLLEGVIYYNFTSTEFNPNLLQLPFWALMGLWFHRAVKDNRLTDWMLLGLWGACGLYSKYSTALMIVCLGLFLICHPKARQRLTTIGPYLAAATAFILFLPHLIWLIDHQFLPFTYASAQLQQKEAHRYFIPGYVLSPVFLLSGQMAALLGFGLLFLIVSGGRPTQGEHAISSFDKFYLKTITLGPFLLTFALSIFFGFRVHDMWCTPFWNFAGLWALAMFRPSLSTEALTRFMYAWVLIFASALIIYAGGNIFYPYIESKTERIHFPGHKLGMSMAEAWHQHYNTPLHYVIGNMWPAGNVAYYAPERPRVFVMGDEKLNPTISRTDVDQKGAILVWCINHCINLQKAGGIEDVPPFLYEKFPRAEIQESFTLPRQTGAEVAPAKIGWAILPPTSAGSKTEAPVE